MPSSFGQSDLIQTYYTLVVKAGIAQEFYCPFYLIRVLELKINLPVWAFGQHLNFSPVSAVLS